MAVSCTPASGAPFSLGATTVTCAATDARGNTGTASFTVTATDTTAPLVTVPATTTVEATGATGASFSYTATATDLVDGNVAVSCVPASGSTFPLGATTVSCTATDARGNSGSASFAVTVADTTGPAITVPPDATVEATSATGASFTYSATASDLVDGSVPVTCTPASGATFPLGATTVACTATDTRSNGGVASFTVTVTDTTGPVITVPANATVEATGATGASFAYTATASDVVDGSAVVTCLPASGATFPLGPTTVTCSATDTTGNSGAVSFTVTVSDTTSPAITVPSNATVEATSANGASFAYTATATDLVDGPVVVTCAPASGSTFPLGATTVSCAATDVHGNTSAASFAVTVTDTAAPVVTVPANATVEATGPVGAAFTYTASATDAASGDIAVACTPASGTTFPLGTTTVTCTATDARGNSGAASFTVTVSDTTGPTLHLPPDASVQSADPTGAIFTYHAVASDSVDGGGNAPLVQQSNLIYQGAFRVPGGWFRGPNLTPWQFDRATFEYGGTALAYNPANNSLFVVGHDQAQLVAEIGIPALTADGLLTGLNTATVLQPFTDVTDLRMSLVSSDPLNPPDVTVKVGGLLPYQHQLYASVYIYYDGRNSQKLSHFVSSPNLSVAGDATGPFELNRPDCNPLTDANCLGAGFFSGYFGRIPFEWQTALGGPVTQRAVLSRRHQSHVLRTGTLHGRSDAAWCHHAVACETAGLLSAGASAARTRPGTVHQP